MSSRFRFSVAILAGGKSERMGEDKSLLTYKGRSFISAIAGESLKVSDDVVVAIGSKERHQFEQVLPSGVSIIQDTIRVSNPMGGMLSAFAQVKHRYVAVLACDSPLVKGEVVTFLYTKAVGHSAALPIWENGDIEPLCAVYKVEEAKDVGLRAVSAGQIGPRWMLALLTDVRYVNVCEIRRYDPDLGSLLNINSKEDYRRLMAPGRTFR